ncbi:hypothetical protein BT93_G1826 [Corymbia citriodora subsp. variegata]|nr:hypothetical protein BT93_G1826 [Corymbia citriodora subsp. variegata]
MAHHLHIQRISLGTFIAVAVCLLNIAVAEWLNHGGDLCNTRSASEEKLIGPSTDISAMPAVADAMVYFPSWNGYLYAVHAFNGGLVWKKNLGELTGLKSTGTVVNVTVSRSTPTVSGKLLIVPIYGPAVVIAVNRSNGRLVWSTQLDPHPLAVITTSGTAYLGAFYIGVSSLEEGLPAEECCTFRGSMIKLNILSGEILWQTYTLPDKGGERGSYAGASIWGSSPAIDPKRRLAYIRDGIRWARQLGGHDVWHVACLVPNNPDCPIGPNLDAEFGEAPMLITIFINGTQRDIAVAVQKSGFAWALDRDFGDIVWFRLAGPGSAAGGGTRGAATDGKRIYSNIPNGAWVALDARSEEILWSTANPSNEITPAPVSVANGVVFAARVYGGISISCGCIYHGNGYKVGLVSQAFPTWTGGTDLYALCVE